MGLTQYVINGVKPLIDRQLLPVIIFVSISLITYTTGSSWGVYAVVIPIIIPLAQSLHANVPMSIGAVVSAGVFGANACLYSDATILTSQSTDTNNLAHSFSQLPYALLAFGLSAVGAGVRGYALGVFNHRVTRSFLHRVKGVFYETCGGLKPQSCTDFFAQR